MAAVGARARLDVAAALVAVGAGIAHGFPSCSRQGTIVAHIPAKEDKTERLNPNNARARPSKSPRRPPRKPVRTKESCTIRHARQNGLFRGFNRFACQAYASCSVKRTIVQKSLPRIMLTCLFCPPASYRKYHFLGYSRENEGLLPRPHRTQSPNATKPLSEARRMPARGIRNPHPRRAQALNNDEARLDSSRASQLPCGRRTVAVRRRCLVAGSLRGAGSARRGRGTRGAGSLRGAGSTGSARGARRARGAGHGRAGRKLGSAFGAHRVRKLGFRPAFRTRLVDLDCCWSEAHGRSFLVSNQYCTRGPPPSGTSPHRGGPPRSTGGNARTEAARLSGA